MRVIKVQEGAALAGSPFAKLEMLAVDGQRTLNRTTYRDGTVKVTSQNGGAWLRTQAEWDAAIIGAEEIKS